VGLLHRMYPRGVRPEDLHEALDRHRYPRGKPLPACPLRALPSLVWSASRASRDCCPRSPAGW
jgi:hypothetical protein